MAPTLDLFPIFCSCFCAAVGDQLVNQASALSEVGEHALGFLYRLFAGGDQVVVRGHLAMVAPAFACVCAFPFQQHRLKLMILIVCGGKARGACYGTTLAFMSALISVSLSARL